MNIPGFSTNGLLMMHDGIKNALADDDNTIDGKNKPYGVRTFPDWKQISDAIESELTARSVTFEAVPW
jgi:hypothetical protein